MGEQARVVTRIIKPQEVMEGAGVRLKRSIASRALDYLDPFLLLDHFGSDDPKDYLAGFPMHPHRGIETVTYMLAGAVRHEDSMGNAGVIEGGDLQWMTAGRAIIHEEMPEPRDGRMEGFQLWVNLPARDKMCEPRYQEVASEKIPELVLENGVRIRVIAGRVGELSGPISGIVAEPTYLDAAVPAGASFSQPVSRGHNAFAYLFEGAGFFGTCNGEGGREVEAPRLVVLGDGDWVEVCGRERGLRFLLVSGRPLNEPVARYGPFVMNTREEILQTLEALRDGTFLRA